MRSQIISVALLLWGCSHRSIYTNQAPAPIATYSQAIRAGKILYVSGQIALRADGSMDTSTIKNECRQTMENITAILKAGNMDMSNVTKCTIYLTDLKNFYDVNEVYGGYVNKKHPPARETVQVQSLPRGAHVEISVIAVK